MPVTPTESRDKIERIIEAFEEAWLAGAKPRIEDFVKNADAPRREVLVELAFTDLEYRLRGGEKAVPEDLRRRFPELASDAAAWRSLIAEEFRQRRRMGQDPSREEYRQRFPELKDDLESALAEGESKFDTILPVRAPEADEKLLPTVGGTRYRVQRKVAEGGMGYVARIVDNDFDRPLAMKVLGESLKGVKELEERFFREARITGQLQHPGIPPVQEKGRLEDGTPYYIMKLIKGHSLQKLLRDRSSPKDRLGHFLGIFLNMCQTMAYAHSRGIIHRDLKPANIMVGAFGEVQVMDWGLAKVLRTGIATPDTAQNIGGDSNTLHIVQAQTSVGKYTEMGAVMGTPGYMPPEQARGETDKLNQRCDVFGLGGILCDILTGKPPFVNSANISGIKRAMMGDLTETFARLDQSGMDADLIALAKRCLAPEMAERPADANAVAEAVVAYQAQAEERLKQAELEQARLVTKAQQEKVRRRDRRILGSCIAALLIAGAFAWQWHREKLAAEHLEQSVSTAVQSVRQIDNAVSLVDYAAGLLQKGNLEDSRKTLDQAKLVADDARKNMDTSRLAEADVKNVDERFTSYAERFKAADKNLRLAQQLALGFEGRQALKESDYDGRVKAVVVFGKAGPRIYERAFADYGAPVTRGEAADVAKQLAAFPHRDSLGLALADWMLLERAPSTVKRLFEVAEAIDPDPVRSRLRKGILNAEADDLVALGNDLAPASQPPMFSVLMSDALHGVQRYDEALRYLTHARDEIPNDFWINHMLGVFIRALDAERITEAIARAESAYVLRPKASFVTNGLVNSFVIARRFDQAELACRRFLEKVDPRDARVRALLADVYAHQGKLAEAEDQLRIGLGFHPDSGFLNASLARVYGNQGKHQDAGKVAQQTLDAHPGFVYAISPLGYAQLHLKQHELALETAEYLIAYNPKQADGFELAAQAMVQLGNQKKAEEYAAKAVAREPKHFSPHRTMGYVLFAQRDYRQGFRSYQTSANLFVGPLPFLKDPARELAQQNMYPEASWLYAEIVKRDPADKAAWDGLISILQVTRETTQTKEHLGPAYAKLSPEQTKRFEAIPPLPRGAANASANVSRAPNAQQESFAPASPKRNR
jgi:serine/threonine protein kinase/Flp pilus assembly protein TadD